MFTKEELDYIDRNLEINYREDHVDKDESSYYSIKVKLATLINKPVETTNEHPNYKFEIVDINATDNPLKITNLSTKEEKTYGVEGLPWKMLKNDQEVLHYIFNNFKADI